MPPSIFISAGEASGEHYGALLVAELARRLKAQGREERFFGMGGPRMAAAGLETIVRSEDVAVMGLTEVLYHLPRIWREFQKLKAAITARRPAVAILIDFPDFHFRLARHLHALGIPVLFFVSPQLWAWKKGRLKFVQRYIDRMLCIFPFEEPFYRERGVQAEFVGHPLAEMPAPTVSRAEFARLNRLDPEKTWIALLPGSRAREIKDNLPEMLEAAWGLEAHEALDRMEFEYLVPLAPTLSAVQQEMVLNLVEDRACGLDIRLVRDARAALHHARASVVASGTATVEAALIGNPFVVVYRVSPITYAIAKRVVTVPHVAMANLIAGKQVVPELLQNDFTAANIVQHIEPLLPDGAPRQSMMQELGRIRGLLKTPATAGAAGGAIGRVAAIALEQLGASAARPASEPVGG
ncbi:MAG: lipid-A-disaccharide synthase [Terracidiphilus sp.]